MKNPDALSQAIMRQRPELAGHVHYVSGRPWCDGVSHTTMCDPATACTGREHCFVTESDGARVCRQCGDVRP